jgi:type III pantothenate kinase
MTTLCIDLGNTRSKIGVFDNKGILLHTQAFAHLNPDTLNQLSTQYSIAQVMLSSVANDAELKKYLNQQSNLQWLELTHQTPLPFQNLYGSPQTLGKDRLAAVAGAHYLYAQTNVLVIDAGTCIKFDAIDQQARYYGGSIAPGIAMKLKALHAFTDRLPLLNYDTQAHNPQLPALIGNNTPNALLSGVINGTIAECAGMIAQYQNIYNPLTILITGGDAPLLQHTLQNKYYTAPHLLLYGLYHLFSYQLSLTPP